MTDPERDACGLCGSTRFVTLYDDDFALLMCRHCGLVFLAGVDRDHKEYYSDEYAYGIDDAGRYIDDEKHNESVLKWVIRHVRDPEGLTLMEIGCSAGFLLKRFRTQGMRVSGIEPNREAVEFARSVNGLDQVECLMLENVQTTGRSFDVVILSQTFEHLADPLSSLSKIKNLVKEDGRLFIEVPNLYSPTGLYPHESGGVRRPSPNHLFVYSPKTLGAFVTRAGFSVRKTDLTLYNIRMIAEIGGNDEEVRLGDYRKALLYFHMLPLINTAMSVFRFFKTLLLRT